MNRPIRTALRCLPTLITAGMLALPTQLSAFDGANHSARIERSVPNRLDVLLDGADTAVQRIPLAGWITTDLVAYRFRFVALDADGIAIALPASASLTLRVMTGGQSSLVRLSSESWDFALPRPFGIRLGATDSLAVMLEVAGLVDTDGELRVSIDFEPTDRRQTRVPLTSERAEIRPSVDGQSSWEWQPAADGRVLAMAGLPLGQAEAITLVDVESGTTVWSSTISSLTPGAAIVAGSVLRLGVPVTAGRTYRITIYLADSASHGEERRGVLAMVLPSQTR